MMKTLNDRCLLLVAFAARVVVSEKDNNYSLRFRIEREQSNVLARSVNVLKTFRALTSYMSSSTLARTFYLAYHPLFLLSRIFDVSSNVSSHRLFLSTLQMVRNGRLERRFFAGFRANAAYSLRSLERK
jgi:hypothetical protein